MVCERARNGDTWAVNFYEMEIRDIADCFRIGTSVRENRFSLEALAQAGVTETSVAEMLATTPSPRSREQGCDGMTWLRFRP